MQRLTLTAAELIAHVRSRRATGTGTATVANDLIWTGVVYFARRDKRSQIPMLSVMELTLNSARRGSEICRLEWRDNGNLNTSTTETTNIPLVTNLRNDPWERYQDVSMLYGKWWGDHLWVMIPAVNIVGQFLQTFKEYAPSQVSGSPCDQQPCRSLLKYL